MCTFVWHVLALRLESCWALFHLSAFVAYAHSCDCSLMTRGISWSSLFPDHLLSSTVTHTLSYTHTWIQGSMHAHSMVHIMKTQTYSQTTWWSIIKRNPSLSWLDVCVCMCTCVHANRSDPVLGAESKWTSWHKNKNTNSESESVTKETKVGFSCKIMEVIKYN